MARRPYVTPALFHTVGRHHKSAAGRAAPGACEGYRPDCHDHRDLWAAGEMPYRDGLYRPGDTAVELHVEGPGAYHPDAGQPIPFRLGGPLDVALAVAEDGVAEAYPNFDVCLPDGTGRMTGGGSGMGNVGWLARLGADGSLRWIAPMFSANPFIGVRYEGTSAIFVNDWRNLLTLDLADAHLI
ncbi:hypothetical protein [Nocardia sp. CA-290969]|uniref:hypothetical protein n=1 Tax=Nocardia sp. CA-290969 TaxID=3239986 RepID=UPI003D89D98A